MARRENKRVIAGDNGVAGDLKLERVSLRQNQYARKSHSQRGVSKRKNHRRLK
jgi:hypothetical protein